MRNWSILLIALVASVTILVEALYALGVVKDFEEGVLGGCA